MLQIEGSQRPMIEDNPRNNLQPVLARRYFSFFSRQAIELLAIGSGVAAVGIAVHSQRTMNEQGKVIKDLQYKLSNLELNLKQEQQVCKQNILYLQTQQSKTELYLQNRLTTAVVFGEQEKAESMIRQKPELLLMAGDVIDCAGRHFRQITAFQYAVWALDWHMWKMILRYLPEEEAKRQVEGLNNGEWVQEHGVQVSWQNLIDTLEYYVGRGKTDVTSADSDRTIEYFVKQVGSAQLTLPAHVINEYMRRDRSFNPCPTFTEKFLPRDDINIWYRPLNNRPGVGRGALGIDTAWSRTSWVGCRSADWADINCNNNKCATKPAAEDAIALKKLLQVRTEQREQLISEFMPKGNPRPKF